MTVKSRVNVLAIGLVTAWAGGLALSAQSPAPAANKKAGEAFKAVTTSTLKELSVDDFIASMGLISADLGLDCADCHPNAGTDKADFVTDTARKVTTRRMVEMVATLNRTNFAGVQRVTCWTCHHGRITPATTIANDAWYETPNMELDDVVRAEPGAPAADVVLDKYVQALGGAQRLAGITSIVATGNAIGYADLGGNAEFSLMAKSPNQRAILISYKDTQRPSSSWTFDGRAGWVKTPRGLLGEYELVGSELDGARFEAQLLFPALLKTALTNWRGSTTRSIGDKDFTVVQGSGPRGFLATLYFDQKTSLLARVVRYGPSPIGRMPSQIDYADYRDVNGVKFPFEIKFQWLDGRYTAKLTKVETNVAIDAAKFGKPTAK